MLNAVSLPSPLFVRFEERSAFLVKDEVDNHSGSTSQCRSRPMIEIIHCLKPNVVYSKGVKTIVSIRMCGFICVGLSVWVYLCWNDKPKSIVASIEI